MTYFVGNVLKIGYLRQLYTNVIIMHHKLYFYPFNKTCINNYISFYKNVITQIIRV